MCGSRYRGGVNALMVGMTVAATAAVTVTVTIRFRIRHARVLIENSPMGRWMLYKGMLDACHHDHDLDPNPGRDPDPGAGASSRTLALVTLALVTLVLAALASYPPSTIHSPSLASSCTEPLIL